MCVSFQYDQSFNFNYFLNLETMETNPEFISLQEMGCSAILSEAAIKYTKSTDLSTLLDWISEHSQQQQKWQTWLTDHNEPNEKQQKKEGQAMQSIQPLINKQMSADLQKKGYSKNVAQKSLLFTNNASIESALAWIQEHKYDADFQEQVFLQGQAYNQSQLTPQEAKQKLKQLTDKARQLRKKREEEEARERQKNRVRYGKEMIQAKRIAQEQAAKRQVELDKIQKQRDQDYKKKLVQQMRRQRNEKLGIKQEPGKQPIGSQKQAKQEIKHSRLEQLQIQCEQVKIGMHAYPQKAKIFFQTAQIYVNNIIKNNGQQKYCKINKQNKAFQSRVLQVFGGLQALQVIGYAEQGGFLIIKGFDLKELQACTSILQRYINWYN